MPIPAFNDFGILPMGLHNCTLEEAKNFFSWNDHRVEVWEQFSGFLEWAESMPKHAVLFVDGSYVTDKTLPNDVDVAIDLAGCSIADQNLWFGDWGRRCGEFKANFLTDSYLFVTGSGNDFSVFFQYMRVSEAMERGLDSGDSKGVLRIEL
jgi:hypothetical protein